MTDAPGKILVPKALAVDLEKPKGERIDVPYIRADRIEELQAQLAKVTAERDEWQRMVGTIAATMPLNKTLSATATLGDLVQYFKDLHNRAEAAEAAIPRAYHMGLDDAAHAGYVACAETRHVTLGDKVGEAIRAIPTPTDLVERATKETGQ